MVVAAWRVVPPRRERADSKSHGGFSSGRLPRALLDLGEPSVLFGSASGTAADVVQVALSRGGKDPRTSAWPG